MFRWGFNMRKYLLNIILMLNIFFIPIFTVHADDNISTKCFSFRKGQLSLQMITGVFDSPFLFSPERQEMDYLQTNLRIGLILSDLQDPKYFFRGNWEGIFEITYSDVEGRTDGYFGGGAILLRYNILSLESRRVYPFIHLGAGIVYNDLYKDRSQSVIGQSIEFTLRGGVGIRLKITDCWSIDLEGAYEHISNGGLAERNAGLNAVGGFVGITRYFDWSVGEP